MMEPFPKILVRIGGHPFDTFQNIAFSDAGKSLKETESCEVHYHLKKEELSEKLLEFIQSTDDKLIQNALLNIRRNIHNGRPPKNKDLEKVKLSVPEDLIEGIDDVMNLKALLEESVERGGEIFDAECLGQRESLQELLKSEVLQKGLILSSRSLLDRIDGYLKRAPEQFRKKEYQNETGFSQYLTRIHAKTSPFSTFTNLALANLEKLENSDYSISGSNAINSHIRLNNGILRHIKSLLKEYSQAFPHLSVHMNPTISETGETYKFLTNNRNIESFQEVDKTPFLDEILKFTKEKQTTCISAILAHVNQFVDSTNEELVAYLRQVIGSGLLEYKFETSGTDPNWISSFIPELLYLKTNEVPHIAGLIDVLKELESIGSQYASSGVSGRIQLSKLAFDKLKDICFKIQEASKLPVSKQGIANEDEKPFSSDTDIKFFLKPEQIFYEDSTRDINISLDEAGVSGILTKVNLLLQELKIFQGYKLENQKMKKYFLKKYSADASVPVFDFYEDFYRDVKAAEKKQSDDEKEENGSNSEADKIHRKEDLYSSDFSSLITDEREVFDRRVKAWFDCFSRDKEFNGEKEIHLRLEDFKNVNGLEKGKNKEISSRSYGAFVQFFTVEGEHDKSKLKACLNSSFAGYGKMMSRFIHLFDEDFKNQIRKRNEKLQSDDELFAENCDATYFNANLHPALMPYEISAPGSNNNLEIDRQLKITDLEVVYSEKTSRLEVRHRPTKKRVSINDLGFQSIKGRSELYQLLERFTHAEYLSVSHLLTQINSVIHKQSNKELPIQILPRIVFEEDVILQRKVWIIDKKYVPEKETSDSDWDYYQKISSWRKENELPEEFFMTITTRDHILKTTGNDRGKLSRDDYKPQYINLQNIFTLNLFAKLAAKAPASIRITEMVPCGDQMLKIHERPYVSECVVEWSF